MRIGLEYKNTEQIFEECMVEQVPFLQYPLFSQTGLVNHAVTTRLGGVSKGDLSSMNLSFTRGDREEDVRENYRRMAKAVDVSVNHMVASRQTHTTNVRIVTEKDAGKGVVRECDYTDVDGLVTNIPGICLVTFYADCVPLLFLDPVKRVIASSHSGWRGTVHKMGQVTVDLMVDEYGCCREDILAAVGPSICQDCYEVSEDVIEQFRENFSVDTWNQLFYEKKDGKYQLNLWNANKQVLLEAGIKPEHMAVTNLCTCCNSSLLFSHRASGGKRGNLAAFLALKEE